MDHNQDQAWRATLTLSLIKNAFFILLCSIHQLQYARESEAVEPVNELRIGNHALDSSQWLFPAISFGQSVVSKHEFLTYTAAYTFKGHHESFDNVTQSCIYGITDKTSLYVSLPIAIRYKSDNTKSSGLEDMLVQLEHLIYVKSDARASNGISLVGILTLPTGSPKKMPATGLGSPRYFFGFTAVHHAIDWYWFTSHGINISTRYKETKPGNAILYQFGLGKNIAYKTDSWILSWLIELDGSYLQYTKDAGVTNLNSGGNSVLLTPSLFFATPHLTLQFAVGRVVCQHLNGIQNKDTYIALFDLGCKFN